MVNPCHRHCPERASGCHISCESYKSYRNYLDEKNAEKRKLSVLADYNSRKKDTKMIENFKNPKHFKGGDK